VKFSVVVNTVNRADSLRRTLDALRWQTHNSFEVIVVNGPSTDTTEQVLDDFADCVRLGSCNTLNLSKSRNVGITLASGDVVAFIDDDAVPEPDWLEDLDRAYADENVAGAGGIVFDHTGCALQYEYSVSDRIGRTRFDIRPPLSLYNIAGAEPFLYLQGTNMSFRRSSLVEIGGFDEEIEYNFDEVDVCLELIDRGYKLSALAGAAVHHKYLASHVRNARRLFTDPYFAIKNRVYFALRHGQSTHSTPDILTALTRYVDEVKAAARCQYSEGLLTAQERDFFVHQVDRGVDTGIERGIAGIRKGVTITPGSKDRFLSFPVRGDASLLRVCFVSQEYPPGDFGGIGRFTAELASGFAQRGHEVHVVTRTVDASTMDLENGVWIHRVAPRDHGLDALVSLPLRGNLDHIAGVYDEVSRLHERRPLDVVSAPIWAAEGLICSLDRRFPTVTTLMTTLHTVAELHKSWAGTPGVEASLRLERAALESAQHLHAISGAILEDVRTSYSVENAGADVIPLGVPDIPFPNTRDEHDSSLVEVLFVGRLEYRKGVDVLLEAIETLVEFPRVHFTLVGKDTINTELGESYRAAFGRRLRENPKLAERVRFAGPVSDRELEELYADADIFCAPSRYESFGLVLVEAMRYGLPVIGSRVGGMPEIITDGRSGLLAEPGDVRSLAECLRRLIVDPKVRQVLGAEARRVYEARFTLDIATENTVAAYARIARSHHTGMLGENERADTGMRLGEILADVVDLGDVAGRLVAARLLGVDDSFEPLEELEMSWTLPDDRFIEAAYQAVLRRPPDQPGIALAQRALSEGTSRVMFVRGLARSGLAMDLGLDTSWLPTLMANAAANNLDRLDMAWPLPDEEFIACAYEILLERRVDDPGLSGWLSELRRGTARAQIVRQLAMSDEARKLGLDTGWLTQLDTLAPQWERRRDAHTPPQLRIRRALARVPVLGAAGRAVVRSRRAVHGLSGIPKLLTELSEGASRRDRQVVELAAGLREHMAMTTAVAAASEARNDRIEVELTELARQAGEATDAWQVGLASSDRAAAGTDLLHEAIRDLGDRVTRQAFTMEQMAQRIDVLQRKSQAMSLDLREQIIAPRETGRLEPYFTDEDSYRAKVRLMNGDIRVNVGCGEKPLPDYVNVDFRELPEVDIVADAQALPFEEGALGELMSSHLIEHFRAHQLATVVLPYWFTLLREGGTLRTVCPNWEAMMTQVRNGDMSLDDFQLLTFGLQDYHGDDHFAMYTPESLGRVLEQVGFRGVEVVTADRQNGLCPEMEVLAQRP